MVVRFDISDEKVEAEGHGTRSPINRKHNGLVSRRVELYESPTVIDSRRQQAYRQQDNVQTNLNHNQISQSYHQQQRQQQSQQDRQQDDVRDTISGPHDGQISEQILPVTTRAYAGSNLVQAGVNFYAEGKYDQALDAFVSALKAQRVSVGDEDICVALTLGNLGSVYLQQENIKEAEAVLTQSLEMKKKLAPDMSIADTLNNLGNCANLRGDFVASMEYYKAALADSKAKGGGAPDQVNALFNIGRLEIQKRNWNEAMHSLNQACRMAREHYGTNHVFVAQTLDLMGFVQLSTSNLDSAMVSFTGALAIYRRIHGPMHLDVANSLFNVGMVREAKNDLGDAFEAYTTSRDLFARLGTRFDHPGYGTVRRSIANVEKLIAKQNRQKIISKHQKATKSASSVGSVSKSFAL